MRVLHVDLSTHLQLHMSNPRPTPKHWLGQDMSPCPVLCPPTPLLPSALLPSAPSSHRPS